MTAFIWSIPSIFSGSVPPYMSAYSLKKTVMSEGSRPTSMRAMKGVSGAGLLTRSKSKAKQHWR